VRISVTKIQVRKHNKFASEKAINVTPIKAVLCPGLGITVGGLSPLTSAVQMMYAYKVRVATFIYSEFR
jgi:hypothetical protein